MAFIESVDRIFVCGGRPLELESSTPQRISGMVLNSGMQTAQTAHLDGSERTHEERRDESVLIHKQGQ